MPRSYSNRFLLTLSKKDMKAGLLPARNLVEAKNYIEDLLREE